MHKIDFYCFYAYICIGTFFVFCKLYHTIIILHCLA